MMKIKDIHIQNFRGIEALSIVDADPHMNLIVGINGAGKTSVLDALAMLLSWFIAYPLALVMEICLIGRKA